MPDALPRLRTRLADLLDRLAVALWGAAHRLRPVCAGPLCPDCQIGPDVGDNCPVCRESWERQKTDEAIYGSGYEQGYLDADLRNDAFGV